MKKLIFLSIYTILLVFVKYWGLFQPLELAMYDHYWQRSPIEAPDERIVIVGIDETDLNQVNWPITNDNLANLILNIKKQNPKVIGLDIFRDLAVSGKLAQLFQESDKLVGVGSFQKVGFPPYLKERERVGTVSVASEPVWGELRRIYLYHKADGTKEAGIPYLSLKLVWEYLKAQGNIEITGDKATGYLKVNGKVIPRTEQLDGGYSLKKLFGYPYLVRWRKGNYQEEQWEDRFPIFTYREAMTAPSDTFTDKIVIIGYRAESIKDQFITPLGWRYGVDVVAQTTSDLLSHIQDNRPIFRFISEGIEYSLLILMIGLAYGHYHFSRLSHVWREIVLQGAIALLILGTIYGLGSVSFQQGIWVPVGQLLLTYALSLVLLLAVKYLLKIHRANKEQAQKLKEQERELTQLYQKQSIEEKQIVLGEFATELAHDLNNEIAVLEYNLEFLSAVVNNPEEFSNFLTEEPEDVNFLAELISMRAIVVLQETLEQEKQAIMNLKLYLAQFRAIYQGEGLEAEQCSIQSLLEECLSNKESLFSQSNIQVRTDYERDYEFFMSALIFKQMINHLLNNAIEAIVEKGEEGRIVVRVFSTLKWIKIMIEDNGIGIRAEIQNRIFDPKFTTKNSMGWGLYFTYQQILKCQGEISVESTRNQGTKVILSIPQPS